MNTYLDTLTRYPDPLSTEDEATATPDQLIEANLRYVVSVARKYQGRGLPLEDLIAEGNTGLVDASRRFDPKKRVRFITYAIWWIRQAIHKALEYNPEIRIPANITQKARQAFREQAHLEQVRGGYVPLSSALDALEEGGEELTPWVRESIELTTRTTISLDEDPFGEDPNANPYRDSSWHNAIAAPSGDPGEELDRLADRQLVAAAMEGLTERERLVVVRYFGLDGDMPPAHPGQLNRGGVETLDEIGRTFNLTRERVRQIKEKAMRKMANKLRTIRKQEARVGA